MAISLETLALKINEEINTIDFNGQIIEVKQYLPINQKLELISWVINQSADDLKFYNTGKLDIFKHIGLVLGKKTKKALEKINKQRKIMKSSEAKIEKLEKKYQRKISKAREESKKNYCE